MGDRLEDFNDFHRNPETADRFQGSTRRARRLLATFRELFNQ